MITLLDDKILVKPEKSPDRVGSILLHPNSVSSVIQGEVIKVGPGKEKDGIIEPIGIEEGNRVIYSNNVGKKIKLAGNEYIILTPSDINAVIVSQDETHHELDSTKGRIIIEPIIENDNVSSGGIIMPVMVDMKTYSKGTVISLAKNEINVDLKVGDIIAYEKNAGIDLTLDDKDYIIINIDSIYGVFE